MKSKYFGYVFLALVMWSKMTAQVTADNTNFILTVEGTCQCPDAAFGESGTFFTGTANEVTYT